MQKKVCDKTQKLKKMLSLLYHMDEHVLPSPHYYIGKPSSQSEDVDRVLWRGRRKSPGPEEHHTQRKKQEKIMKKKGDSHILERAFPPSLRWEASSCLPGFKEEQPTDFVIKPHTHAYTHQTSTIKKRHATTNKRGLNWSCSCRAPKKSSSLSLALFTRTYAATLGEWHTSYLQQVTPFPFKGENSSYITESKVEYKLTSNQYIARIMHQ